MACFVGLLLQMAGLENEEEIKTIQEQVSAMLAELLDLIVPLIQEAIAGLYDSILKDKDTVVPAFVAASRGHGQMATASATAPLTSPVPGPSAATAAVAGRLSVVPQTTATSWHGSLVVALIAASP